MTEGTLPDRVHTGVTLHLVPESVWLAQAGLRVYRPERFSAEGFVHCTDGEHRAVEVGNRYSRDDPRPYLILDVDLSRVSAPALYDDEAREYPHVYGPIEREAILRVRRVERARDGAFIAIGSAIDDATT